MKKTILFLQAAVLGLLAACSQPSGEEQLRNEVQYVNPFIGTGFHGHTFPGATRPFALVQVSPDTHIMGWDASSGYHYDDSQIYAFSHTHLSGTGIGDLGDVAILPFSGGDSIRPVATFKKETEKATPGYYAVRLDNFGINVELTSTDRVGFHKYTYDNPKDRRVLLDLGHVLQPNWGHKLVGNEYLFVNDSTVEGTIRTQGWAHFHAVSYRITFSEPIETLYQYIDGNLRKDSLFLRLNTPGDLKFKDVNGDGEITTADRTMIGDPTPDVTYGITLGVNYKNWELGIDMMGQGGNQIFRTWDNYNWSQFNFMEQRMDRWHGPGTSNTQPLLNTKHTINNLNSEYYIEDGSFFRIRNIELGYTFDPRLLSRIKLQALRIYGNIQNAKTWSRNTGYTPEVGGSATSFGIDGGGYPMPVVYTLGFNLSF